VLSLKRIIILFLVFTLASVSLIGYAADEPTTLTIGTIFPEASPEGVSANYFAKKVAEDSEGRIKVDIFHASTLGGSVDQMENVIAGTQDMFLEGHEYYGHFVKGWNILGLFFLFRDREHLHKFMTSDTNRKFEQEFIDEWGVRVLSTDWNFDRGPYKVVVSKKPIKSIDDFQGVKIRAPDIPIYIRSLDALGGAVATINWGEVYLALSQGIVDAVECPIVNVPIMKFQEVANNVTFTKHLLQPASIVINEEKFQSFPEDLQQILINAANATGIVYTEEVLKGETKALKELKEAGVNFIMQEEIDIEKWQAKISKVVPVLEEEGYWPKGLYEEVQSIK